MFPYFQIVFSDRFDHESTQAQACGRTAIIGIEKGPQQVRLMSFANQARMIKQAFAHSKLLTKDGISKHSSFIKISLARAFPESNKANVKKHLIEPSLK